MRRNTRSDYTVKNGFSLNMYSDDELRQIHFATLEVLQHEGVTVGCKEAIALFEENGADVNYETGKVKIQPYMVEDAIRSAPSTIILAGRDPKHDVVLDGSRVNYTTFGCGINIYDIDTDEHRETVLTDVADTARVADAIENVDIYTSAVSAGFSCPAETIDLHMANAFLTNTTKHCMHVELSRANAQKYLEMGAVIAGGMDKLRERPLLSAMTAPSSPLQLSHDTCGVIMTLAKEAIPCCVISMAMSGSTAPITLAGTLVTHNSEVLSGIVLSQLVRRGAPIMYGSSTTTFDLRYVTAPVGAPELGMFSASVAALAQFYLLPSYVAGT